MHDLCVCVCVGGGGGGGDLGMRLVGRSRESVAAHHHTFLQW